MHLTSTSLWLAILQVSHYGLVSAENSPLRPRDYGTRDYYALHLMPDVSPTDIAQQLGLEHEGLIGELDDHHLFSTPCGGDDIVSVQLERNRRLRKRSLESGAAVKRGISDSILFAEKQKLKKLVKRTIPSKRQELSATTRQSREKDDQFSDDIRIEDVVKALDIKDPIFLEQWHLVSPFGYI